MQQQLTIGTLLRGGSYKIEEVLGQGSFGITYLAEHTIGNNWCSNRMIFSFEMNPKGQQKEYNLQRFADAHNFVYPQALRELKEGRKRSHWIWYIFPQQKGLGHSHNSRFYGLDGEAEARAYIAHPILGERLRECCRALLLHKDKDIRDIMGSGIDVRKLNASMNLFNRVSPNDVFAEVIETFFQAKKIQ